MNTRVPLRRALALIAAISLVSAHAQLPEGSNLSITRGSTSQFANVAISDPGNHTWVLQKSADLETWTNVEALKLHNGRYQRKVDIASLDAGAYYFRTVFDPSQQTATSTLADALRLPVVYPKYANPSLPPNFLIWNITNQDTTPQSNPTTNAGATLGRVLFYDKRLSRNQTVSCSTCHVQARAFSDGKRFSTGFAGGQTARNTMGLTNTRWYGPKKYMWDERAASLEELVFMPIESPIEMGLDPATLITRLAAEPFYAPLFTKAFGDANVTQERIARALAQFVRSIISTKSKYDTGVAQNFSNFTVQEKLGREIFDWGGRGRCSTCHSTDNFSTEGQVGSVNNGLEFPFTDPGVGGTTGNSSDNGKFKSASLRNVELTAPYMHDGRFATLEEVVEFYNSGVVATPNLPWNLTGQNGPLRLNLTTEEKAALVAFLKTLTDTSMTTDPKLSDPFYYGD